MKISNIQIENFRSIRSLDIDLVDLTIFVGQNDCGKSNILRALNLFFNEETNPGEPLSFANDYNFFENPNRRAKEIVVRITIELPENYRRINGDRICWEKKWRADGKYEDKYFSLKKRVNKRKALVYENFNLPSRSRLHSALRSIEYEYVPAIRDTRYFDKLQGRLYKAISEVAEMEFRGSSEAFEKAIGSQLTSLTSEIEDAIKLKTQLSLPKDLSGLFERLEFLSGDQRTSLSNRGDGIKTRHIPLILKFLAEKKQQLRTRGSVPSTFIWGYEEPENNLEFSNSLLMAESFANYAESNLAQLLVTTHSPVFYNINEEHPATHSKAFHVFQADIADGTQVKCPINLDVEMDTMRAIAPQLRKVTELIKRETEARVQANIDASQEKPVLYLEGKSDQLVFEKALQVFFPEQASKICCITKSDGAGHNYVKDMTSAWATHKKHHPNMPRGAGILDQDAKKHVDKSTNQTLSPHSKIFFLETPKHLRAAKSKGNGIQLDIALEHLYPKKYWDYALLEGWLEELEPTDYLTKNALNQALRAKTDPTAALHEDWAIFATHRFKYEKKIAAAKHVSKLRKDAFATDFAHLEDILTDVFKFLFPSVPLTPSWP
ncbi:MAG: AAA family ATPase [Parvibaculum sp.]